MQPTLFPIAPIGPNGFRYQSEFITREEEKRLMAEFKKLHLDTYTFQGYEAKRKIKEYDKDTGFPFYLLSIIKRAAEFTQVPFDTVEHALITEYSPGTPIGWHRDQPPYDQVIGISLGSAVPFRFRRKVGNKWERITVTAEPRSIYIMSGPARSEWQHSIPPVTDWRYSLTIRTVRR